MILVLFPETYPYDGGSEQTFLEKEMGILTKKFERVIVVPRRCDGHRLPLQDGIEVEIGYASYLRSNRILSLVLSLVSTHLYLDLLNCPPILWNFKALVRLIKFVGNAELSRRWVLAWLTRQGVSPADCVFYTYWFDDTAFGLGLAKRTHPELCVVSRTHGYDLYEERYDFPYWPRRRETIAYLDCLFPDSNAGLKYLEERYPEFKSKYEASLLGVQYPGFITRPSQGAYVRIVSCSKLVPVKRVELIMAGIAQAARLRRDVRFEWTHFGEGETRLQMATEALRMFPKNASASFPGYESQDALLRFYRDNPVDVFMNVSASEGTPVAIMEAVSCGIPIIATAVGGNVEIVTDKNGWLLPPNPSPAEVASALTVLCDNQNDDGAKREGSLQMWRECYNSDVNFSNFADSLIAIRTHRG